MRADPTVDGPPMVRPIRFGVLCPTPQLQRWQARCIETLRHAAGADLDLVLLTGERDGSGRRGRSPLWGVYKRVRPRTSSPVVGRIDATPQFEGADVVHVDPVVLDDATSIPDEVVRDVRARRLDLMLAFGISGLQGDILRTPRHGVWVLDLDDAVADRHGPRGFWEVYHSHPLTTARLTRLDGDGNGGRVLHQGVLKTQATYGANREDALRSVAAWPARVAHALARGVPPSALSPYPAESLYLGRHPSNGEMVRFLYRATRRMAGHVHRVVMKNEVWNVGVVPAPIHALVEQERLPPVRWFPDPPAGTFIADPFAVHRDGSLHVLAEEFPYLRDKGHISHFRLDPTTLEVEDHEPLMDLPFHLSYPFVLETDGELFLVPEAHESAETVIWRAVDFPSEWERWAVALPGERLVDPTIVEHDGRYWLFATHQDHHPDVNLFAWYADALDGEWTPHALNPVKSDIRSARPAGTPFHHGGRFFRPAQDCSRTYGGGLVVNEVKQLTPDSFVETVAAHVRPARDEAYADGLHHISSAGDVTLLDAKRHRFVPASLVARLKAGTASAFPRLMPRDRGADTAT